MGLGGSTHSEFEPEGSGNTQQGVKVVGRRGRGATERLSLSSTGRAKAQVYMG